ncbi:hypothetical protein EST38_g11287 [Candolleomyces aberdarensis]|uniref:SUN domain-containing protein n=1 Tax=Candolleomyces aberdarensis TaxID=2316362 RepID=A0A4Q2D5A1_9AGAR|nr:hypothetical protein EST38_g11287 [Candolleomyces aberdarensis]
MSRTPDDKKLAYLPLDAFIMDDADMIFGYASTARVQEPQSPQKPWLFSIPWSFSSFVFSKKAFVHGIVTLLLLANVWNITLALSDISHLGCSYYYRIYASADLPRVCHSIIPPYQQWPAFKSLEARVSRHTQRAYGLAFRLSKLDDVLGVALGTDRDLARLPQANIIGPLTTSERSADWISSISDFFSSNSSQPYLPTIVLDSPPNAGECWQFAGDRGHVAILLAHPAKITAFSIVLPPFLELWDEVFQAPKLLHAWGHPIRPLSNCSDSELKHVSDFRTSSARHPAYSNLTEELALLARFEYDITTPFSRQIFPIQFDCSCENATFDFVVMEVLANWGAEKTCLYHMGIHGKRP